eukprot:scaffold5467_cov331-Prasinococcus_capsulatus_cf.AAC.2
MSPFKSREFVEKLNEQGDSALTLACKGGHVEAVRALLDIGANVSGRNGCVQPAASLPRLPHTTMLRVATEPCVCATGRPLPRRVQERAAAHTGGLQGQLLAGDARGAPAPLAGQPHAEGAVRGHRRRPQERIPRPAVRRRGGGGGASQHQQRQWGPDRVVHREHHPRQRAGAAGADGPPLGGVQGAHRTPPRPRSAHRADAADAGAPGGSVPARCPMRSHAHLGERAWTLIRRLAGPGGLCGRALLHVCAAHGLRSSRSVRSRAGRADGRRPREPLL